VRWGVGCRLSGFAWKDGINRHNPTAEAYNGARRMWEVKPDTRQPTADSHARYTIAIRSISTNPPFGNCATPTVVLAGFVSPKYEA